MRLACGIGLLAASANLLVALDPALAVSQYLHTSWTQEEGADLPGIQALAQTPDGYLWLGGATGLIRFDGVRFVHWEAPAGERLPSNDIRFLVASTRRGLWIGSALGISRLDGGHLTAFPAADRWLGGAVVTMVEDRLGRLWVLGQASAGSSLGMLSPNGSFHIYGQPDGLPAQPVQAIFEDRHHIFWLGTTSGLCRWSPGSEADCLSLPPINVFYIGEGANGELLVGDRVSRSILQLSDGRLSLAIPLPASAPAVPLGIPPAASPLAPAVVPKVRLRDRDGNVWMGTVGQGLMRWGHGRLETFTRRDGLSSDAVNSLSEDREGNLWVGTARGIDRFRDPKVVHLSSLEGLSGDQITAVYAAHSGGAWVAASGRGLNLVTDTHIARYLTDSGLPSNTVNALYEEPGGKLWVATTLGLVHSEGERFVAVRDENGKSLDRVFAITGNNQGALALADAGRGLFTIHGGVAHPLAIPGRGVYQLQYDRQGVLWVGYYEGGVAAIDGKSYRLYTASDGLGSGSIRAIHQDAAGDIWVGTVSGLSRFRNGSWTTWTARDGLPEGGVRGIADEASRHALWLVTTAGMLRLSMTELDTVRASGKSLSFPLYGLNEGIRLAANSSMTNPLMTTSSDGRVWLCTQDGLAIVDPARIRSNPAPPPVAIEQMAIDGAPLDQTSPGGVSFRGRQLQIVYTALSLMAPERIRFKYRLEGLDRDWTEAEGRRNVAYVGLPPGPYRFHVIACNNDGVWNNEGAALAFLVKPYYYQTWWFAVFCAAAIGLLAWGAHRLRVRSVVSRLHLIAQERARLMRELHDSLLQGFAGVVYQLEAVARQFDSAPEASKRRLERAIEQADQSLHEARRTMLSMRLPALENSTLPEALSAIATQLSKEASIAFSLEVKGTVQQLPYDQQANVYLIGREAVTNSVNHARASRIVAALTYSNKDLRLTVQDDGAGFDPHVGAAKQDHWGIRGMRERAESIGAEFMFETAPGRGTRIEVIVPRKK